MSRAPWKSPLPGLALAFVATLYSVNAYASPALNTAPVGFINLSAPAGSDVLVSLSFTRPSVYSGTVGGLSGAVITAAGSPGWTVNRWVQSLPSQPDTYYVQFKSGSAAGRFYSVVANTANTVTIDWNGETPAAAVSDTFVLIPYWTLGTLYPASQAGTAFTASSSDTVHGTEILLPASAATAGINLSASATFYFFGGSWRKVGASPSASFDATVVAPNGYLIQRNRGAATTVSVYGGVPTGVISTLLSAQGGGAQQDNAVALPFPGTVTLDDSNLRGSGAFRASTSPFFHTDELYVFDNTASGINKAAVAVYYYYNGAWRKAGAPVTTNFGPTAVFVPGTGVMVRKGGTGAAAATAYWTYTSPVSP